MYGHNNVIMQANLFFVLFRYGKCYISPLTPSVSFVRVTLATQPTFLEPEEIHGCCVVLVSSRWKCLCDNA